MPRPLQEVLEKEWKERISHSGFFLMLSSAAHLTLISK
jgi:hypothetical protein